MSKKRKALQAVGLLSAVSGATLIVAVGSTSVRAAETNRVDQRCWDQNSPSGARDRLHGCAYIEYGLTPKPIKGNGAGTPATSPTGGTFPGGSAGPQEVDPYAN